MRYAGNIGFAEQKEVAPGVWEDVITERRFRGEVMWSNRRYIEDDKINTTLRLNNAVSVVADQYINEHFADIRYITWAGRRWTPTAVEVDPPRVKIYMGGIYNGPTP